MQTDIINDALVKIFTAERAGRYDVTIQPASKLLGKVLDIMQSSGYITTFEPCHAAWCVQVPPVDQPFNF